MPRLHIMLRKTSTLHCFIDYFCVDATSSTKLQDHSEIIHKYESISSSFGSYRLGFGEIIVKI